MVTGEMGKFTGSFVLLTDALTLTRDAKIWERYYSVKREQYYIAAILCETL